MFGVWRYDTPLYMGAMADMLRCRGAASVDGPPVDLPQRQLVRGPHASNSRAEYTELATRWSSQLMSPGLAGSFFIFRCQAR